MEEIMEQTAQQEAQTPEQEAQTAHTLALEQEVESLRREKHHRQLADEAAALLQERGIDPSFAPFVLGDSAAATRKKVEQFDRKLADTLRKHLTDRLPVGEPKDFRAAKMPQRRRGIRKVG